MDNRDLVVIGGSTGSIGPLRNFLGALPADLPAAVAVALHIPATSTGIFTSIASAVSNLRVQTAQDGMKIEHGQVYVAGPDRHLIIADGHCKLGTGPRENMVRPAIDPLFRSAAASFGSRAIGIVLSGMLNDGADGLRAIKRCGGIAMVQAPEDCIASDMPLAALEATEVDLSAAIPRLTDAALRFVREKPDKSLPIPKDILLEIEIALGEQIGSSRLAEIAEPVPLTCPDCGGVLSQMKQSHPLRFRCQVGHGYTARVLSQQQEGSVDEAMRVALRIIEERAELVGRMGRDAGQVGRSGIAELYRDRAEEYRRYAETLRTAILDAIDVEPRPEKEDDKILHAQVIGPEQEAG